MLAYLPRCIIIGDTYLHYRLHIMHKSIDIILLSCKLKLIRVSYSDCARNIDIFILFLKSRRKKGMEETASEEMLENSTHSKCGSFGETIPQQIRGYLRTALTHNLMRLFPVARSLLWKLKPNN